MLCFQRKNWIIKRVEQVMVFPVGKKVNLPS